MRREVEEVQGEKSGAFYICRKYCCIKSERAQVIVVTGTERGKLEARTHKPHTNLNQSVLLVQQYVRKVITVIS